MTSDIAAVADVLRSDWLTTGPKVEAFEHAFAERIGVTGAAACANGTAALHLATLALDLSANDHAVVPAITFLATANCVRFVGAEVIFADVDPNTGLMMPEHVERALAEAGGERVKALFPVHMGGQTGDPAAIKDLANRRNLHVVEDACHALGTSYQVCDEDFIVGSCAHADLAIFSFHPLKAITTGEGGMVTGTDLARIARIKRLRNHGMIRDPADFENELLGFDGGKPNPWYYELPEIGFNYRLSDIQCALGINQLVRLDEMLSRRRQLVDLYRHSLGHLAPHVQPVEQIANCSPGWHLFVVLINFEALDRSRAEVVRSLAEMGIGTQVHYVPIHLQPYYRRRYGDKRLPGAEQYYRRCLSLPLFPAMTELDVARVVEGLTSVLS